MRLIGTCMAANEADVIEAFVRHNLRHLDALVVLDHASVDRTPQVLASLKAEGLPVVALRDNDRAFRQPERQTALARRFLRELDADWCFVLDADEFIDAPGREPLHLALAALPPGAHGAVPLVNYLGVPAAADERHPARRITRRLATERHQVHKVVLRRDFADDPALQVSLGNHAAVRVLPGRVEPARHARLQGVRLAHFPVRSAEQVARKALLGWLSHRLTDPDALYGQAPKDQQPANHWRDLFERLSTGRLEVGAELLEEARRLYAGRLPDGTQPPVGDEQLVEDPVDSPVDLRYTTAQDASPLAALAAWTERLVTAVASSSAAGARPPTAT